MRIVLLCGGVGGAKLAYGLGQILSPDQYVIIGNTGDDFIHMGLTICPDLDTIMYTLAGVVHPVQGWGRMDETWRIMETVTALGGSDWFNLGDTDLATHLVRTAQLQVGQTLTEVTAGLCERLEIRPKLLPMSNHPAPTRIQTEERILPFQEWFVKERWQPVVKRVILPKIAPATPAAIKAIQAADAVIIAPSNPYVSIDPILNAHPIRALLADVANVVIAVSPIIAGDAVKGPTAKMIREWGGVVSAETVAHHYHGLIHGFVYDQRDQTSVNIDGVTTFVTNTLMKTNRDRIHLAQNILNFAEQLLT